MKTLHMSRNDFTLFSPYIELVWLKVVGNIFTLKMYLWLKFTWVKRILCVITASIASCNCVCVQVGTLLPVNTGPPDSWTFPPGWPLVWQFVSALVTSIGLSFKETSVLGAVEVKEQLLLEWIERSSGSEESRNSWSLLVAEAGWPMRGGEEDGWRMGDDWE